MLHILTIYLLLLIILNVPLDNDGVYAEYQYCAILVFGINAIIALHPSAAQ